MMQKEVVVLPFSNYSQNAANCLYILIQKEMVSLSNNFQNAVNKERLSFSFFNNNSQAAVNFCVYFDAVSRAEGKCFALAAVKVAAADEAALQRQQAHQHQRQQSTCMSRFMSVLMSSGFSIVQQWSNFSGNAIAVVFFSNDSNVTIAIPLLKTMFYFKFIVINDVIISNDVMFAMYRSSLRCDLY